MANLNRCSHSEHTVWIDRQAAARPAFTHRIPTPPPPPSTTILPLDNRANRVCVRARVCVCTRPRMCACVSARPFEHMYVCVHAFVHSLSLSLGERLCLCEHTNVCMLKLVDACVFVLTPLRQVCARTADKQNWLPVRWAGKHPPQR